MTDLPWIVPPAQATVRRVGTPASGILEIPVLGGLGVDEVRMIADLTAEDLSAFVVGAQLAEVIGQAEDMSHVEAFRLVEDFVGGRPMKGKAAEIRIKYAKQLADVAQIYANDGHRTIQASITAIIRIRLNRPGWTMPPGFPNALYDGIWALIREEQAAEKLPPTPVTEEDLGKQRAADGPPSKPTGRRSSGSSPGPTRASSAGKPSVGS